MNFGAKMVAVSGKECCFSSARLSFLSVISEESESHCKDPIKACTFTSASPQIFENGLSQMEEIKVCLINLIFLNRLIYSIA